MEPAGRQMIVPESAGTIRVDVAAVSGYNGIVAAYSVLPAGDDLCGNGTTEGTHRRHLMFTPKEGRQWQAS